MEKIEMPDNWGVRPILFYIGQIPVYSYSFFMLLAIIVGFLLYKYQLKKDGVKSSHAMYIALFALFFGSIGAKVPLVFMYWKELNNHTVNLLLSGRTIVGGLIGGFIGTVLAKKIFKIKEKMGNQLAIPVAVGMAIGRVGCLLRGCCYGKPTDLFCSIDFGDNIKRHPTQIYEIIFDLLLALFLMVWKKKRADKLAQGELFRLFLTIYLSFRFVLEFIRVEKISLWIFTDFQWLCIVSVIFINRGLFWKKREHIEK